MGLMSKPKPFIDINNRKRYGFGFKIIKHKIRDAVHNNWIEVEYVEVEVLGKRGTHKEWYPVDEFIKRNPHIKLKRGRQ